MGHGHVQSRGGVIFEYAYLSARLTRARVAICSFFGAGLPSYVNGVKLIVEPTVGYDATNLPGHLATEIVAWLQGLPRLAEQMPPTVQLHAYSGRWEVEIRPPVVVLGDVF